MPSLNEESNRALRKSVIIAIFAAVSVVLSIVETFIPITAAGPPGAKLGLANIMVLTCLYFLPARSTLVMVLLKTLLTAFIFGTFSSFLFSIMGALFSFVAMWFLLLVGRNKLSMLSISVVGGITHNLGQVSAAAFYFSASQIFYYFPPLMLTGVATGIAIGIAVKYLIPALSKLALFEGFLRD